MELEADLFWAPALEYDSAVKMQANTAKAFFIVPLLSWCFSWKSFSLY
jgi:hypothetical protein